MRRSTTVRRFSASLLCLFGLVGAASAQVPLRLWTTPKHPSGIVFPGLATGATLADFDQDGWVDLCILNTGQLWRNEGGKDFVFATDLRKFLPPAALRYGGHWADYDNDGDPDVACATYKYLFADDCFRLLRNEGQARFLDVSKSHAGGLFCTMRCETIAWGDTDGDGNLDLFIPSYPWPGGTSNTFLYNLGPVAANGEYQFKEMTGGAGLGVLSTTPRPEGAQFCDMDSDGDLDLFSNTVLYHNLTRKIGSPRFEKLLRLPRGATAYDEGALFLDFDMDGDFDLLIASINAAVGIVLFENRGDGTFVDGPPIPQKTSGIGLGLSVGDYDNDGDLDMNTRLFFRKNVMVETGKPGYVMDQSSIPSRHISAATISFADLDKDGDLDALIGNYWATANLYRNTTYTAKTPQWQKHHLRVKVVRDSAKVAGGLETEFGASVEVRVHGDTLRRRQHTASGAGYINQNEYTLNFALPAKIPVDQTVFDLSVDFPSMPYQGYWRVDKRVNPVLGNLRLSQLRGAREIVIYRSGKVVLNDQVIAAPYGTSPRLTTTTGGLVLASVGAAPPALRKEPTGSWVGMAFDTQSATQVQRMTEILLDGELDVAVNCSGSLLNLACWDVTTPGAERLVLARDAKVSKRNDRHYLLVDLLLLPRRNYRLLARVKSSRATGISAPVVHTGLRVSGGLRLMPASPCSGAVIAAASVDASKVYAAFRYASDQSVEWMDLGLGLAGLGGVPRLRAQGSMTAGSTVTLNLSSGRPSSPGLLVVGLSPTLLPFLGGTLVPAADTVVFGLGTDTRGGLSLSNQWPGGFPPNLSLYFQVWLADAAAPLGGAASNALLGVSR